MKRRSEEIRQNKEEISQIIDYLLSTAVHLCESCVIEEMVPEKVKPSKRKTSNARRSRQALTSTNEKLNDNSKGILIQRNRETEDITAESSDTEVDTKIPIRFEESNLSSNKTDRDFPKISIDHEANNHNLHYFVTFDAIKNILSVVFWSISVKNIEDKSIFEIAEEIFDLSKNSNFQDEVLAHEYLNNLQFLELLKDTNKFLMKNPIEIVSSLISE